MKNFKLYKLLWLLVVVLSFYITSCNKQLDINSDPTLPSLDKATPSIIFPAAVLSSAGRIGGELAIIGGMWSQYWTQGATANQYKIIDAYNIQGSDYNNDYTELFSGALNDYQSVITQSAASNKWPFYLMATVMKAYTYQVLVDLYDQVPYTEAFQGSSNLQPKFDDGYTIYKGLLAEIDNALSKNLTAYILNADEKKSDLIFAGNINNWIAFANTLKLKMYLRMINAKPTEAQSGITALYTAGATFLNADAAITSFSSEVDKQNPLYAYNFVKLNTTTNLKASKTLVSYLTNYADPRINKYFGKANPVARDQGDYSAATNAAAGDVPNTQATDPVYFISKAESNFLQAEALERYYAGVGAKAKYDAGVTASFAACGQAIGTFLTGSYAYNTTGTMTDRIEQIIVQKWAAAPYGNNTLEPFFDKNRTGFPRTSAVYSTSTSYIPGQIVYSKNGVTGNGNFPKRLPFPDVERTRNQNTPANVSITTKVWWGL